MMYAGRMFLLSMMLASAVALPNHLKAVVVDAEPVHHGKSVSASFGGYSAQASLEGAGPAGGLSASASSPFGSAGAGLGGVVPGDQGTAATNGAPPPSIHAGGHKPTPVQGQGAFDGIFNIPISVLQAVNTYLNNRGPVTKPVHRRRGHRPRPSNPDDEEAVYKTVTPVKGEAPGADTPGVGVSGDAPAAAPAAAPAYGASAPDHSTGTQAQSHPVLYKRVNYDDIFNIPISALKSVNDLLNG